MAFGNRAHRTDSKMALEAAKETVETNSPNSTLGLALLIRRADPMMTRFIRDDRKIRFLRDIMGEGYYIITETPKTQTTEYFPLHLYPFHCTLYEENGYQRMKLCESCKGQGWRWMPSNHGEDAERDLCPDCQGEGGMLQ